MAALSNLPEAHREVLRETVLLIAESQAVKERWFTAVIIRNYIRDVLHPMVAAPATAEMAAECQGILADLQAVTSDLLGISERYEALGNAIEQYRLN